MASFPVLSTGAVAQYPLSRGTSYAVETVQFIDGTQQRCLTRGKALRRWLISLTLLTEIELAQIEQFFDALQGNFEPFTFVDPITGVPVANCILSNSSLTTQYLSIGNGTASLWIEETNG
jgi:hypothetical protein